MRQGCPISPYIFVLCAEVLALKVINNVFHCMRIGNREIKLLTYAGDTTFFLNDDRGSLHETVKILSDFEFAAGLKVNLKSALFFPLGPFVSHPSNYVRDFDIKISKGPVRLFGISFTHNGDLFHLNFMPKLSRLKSLFGLWSVRDLTPMGRNIVVKTSALSQLVYLFLVLPNPTNYFIKEVESIIFYFIWSGKPDKVKRTAMINQIDQGGLKVIHVESFINSLKCTWIRRYCEESAGPYKCFFDISLHCFGESLLFQCNCSSQDVIRISNSFVREECRHGA